MKNNTQTQIEQAFEQEMITELKQIDGFEKWTTEELKEYHQLLITYSEMICATFCKQKNANKQLKISINQYQNKLVA